jgi:hypothetical protein
MRTLFMIAVMLSALTRLSAQQTTSPVPTTPEPWITGWIDVGYRWRTDVGGSFDTYRTFVDLGSGPKLLGTEFTLIDPMHRYFDKIRVHAYSWGGEPYGTFHLDAEKSKLYRFSADYRDIAYFDFLPSYADPLLSRGIILNEQSFDTRRKIGSFQLDLLPTNRISPYVGYDFNSGSGTGVTAFITNANQFPVPNTLYDLTNLYRGGVNIELRRFHATLEGGATTFKNDQSLFQNPGSTNFGNVITPVLGQTTFLTGLLAAYGITGRSVYTKGLLTAHAASWFDVYGQFLYSQPKSDVNYQQAVTGNLLLNNPLLFYTSQSYLVSAAAKLPHTTATLGGEERPMRRVRIQEQWLTDRLHNAGSAVQNSIYTNSSTSQQIVSLLNSSLVNNYNQVELDLFYDATSKLVLRGGYRYVWGDVSDAVLPPAGLVSSERARLRRNLGLAGVIYRPLQKLSLLADAEIGSSGAVYFRTSLSDYQRVRAQARYQALKTLSITGDFTALLNQYPVPGVNSDFRAQQQSVSLLWTPAKTWNLQGAYTRATVNSNIDFLDPGTLQPEKSLYRDNAHTATGLFNLNVPRGGRMEPNITAGGSLFISSGSRPTRYFQPIVTLRLSVIKHVSWFAEWRYYGYNEVFYPFEDFHAHLVTTGVRLTR